MIHGRAPSMAAMETSPSAWFVRWQTTKAAMTRPDASRRSRRVKTAGRAESGGGIAETFCQEPRRGKLMTDDERRALEEIAARAWPHREELRCDGWLLRFSGGGSKRANSVQTLRWSGADTEAAIAAAEADYRGRGLTPVFQILDVSVPGDLDRRLERRGYRVVDRTLLMLKPVTAVAMPAGVAGHDDLPPGSAGRVSLDRDARPSRHGAGDHRGPAAAAAFPRRVGRWGAFGRGAGGRGRPLLRHRMHGDA